MGLGEKFILEGQMNRKPYVGYSFVRTEWEFKKIILTAKVNTEKLKGASKLDNFEEFEKLMEESRPIEDEDKDELKILFTGAHSFGIDEKGLLSVILELNDEVYIPNAEGIKFEMHTTAMKRELERHFGIGVSEELKEETIQRFNERKMLRLGFITKFEKQEEK